MFEKAVADHCGAQKAVAVNSATSALHIACLALGVGPGDIVWTSPITFVASARSVFARCVVDSESSKMFGGATRVLARKLLRINN
jgi:dTDP-4-amino-4,6-dideoxygalactose transaminase